MRYVEEKVVQRHGLMRLGVVFLCDCEPVVWVGLGRLKVLTQYSHRRLLFHLVCEVETVLVVMLLVVMMLVLGFDGWWYFYGLC